MQAAPQQPGLLRLLELLCCCLVLLIGLGEMMMVFTALYFHTLPEKLAGTLCGLGSWALVYKVVYPLVFNNVNVIP